MKPRKRNSASAEKRTKESIMDYFSLCITVLMAQQVGASPQRGMMLFIFLQPVPQGERKEKYNVLIIQ